jgi:membrane dipeptidase
MKLFPAFALAITLLAACGSNEVKLARCADKIHASIMTIDTHCDTPMEFSDGNFDLGMLHDEGCVDFPRMVKGGLHAEFFAVFIGQGPGTDSAYNKVKAEAVEILEAIHKNVDNNSEVAEIGLTADDAYRLKKTGRLAVYIGMENGYPIGKDISLVKYYYDLGARYITLAHTRNNDICDSSTDPNGAENDGLSSFGADVVKEMNRIGMIVDISHVSDKSFYDVLQITKAPVIASHSSCRALCGAPRNLSDDMLLALKENGGVIQICILSDYLKTPEPNPEMEAKIRELKEKYGDYNALSDDTKKTVRREYNDIRKRYEKLAGVKDIVDHIDHVVQVIGIDYVGIGSDFDGGGGVEGCRTVAEMKNITIELLRRGYTKSDIKKIWGANFMRVFRKVEEIAVNTSPGNQRQGSLHHSQIFTLEYLSVFNIQSGSALLGSLFLRLRYRPNFFRIGTLCVSTNSIRVPSGSSIYEKCPAASPISKLLPSWLSLLSTVNGKPFSLQNFFNSSIPRIS